MTEYVGIPKVEFSVDVQQKKTDVFLLGWGLAPFWIISPSPKN